MISASRLYFHFNNLISNIQYKFEDKTSLCKKINKTDLNKRIIQEIINRTINNFYDFLLKENKKKQPTNKYISNGLLIDTKNGDVKITNSLFIYEIFKFIYFNLRLLLLLFISFFKKNNPNVKKISIFIGYPTINENNENDFSNFCLKGPIRFLPDKNSQLIVETNILPRQRNESNIIYVKNIFHYIITNHVNFSSKLNLIYKIFINFFFYLLLFKKNKLLILAQKDFVNLPLIENINARGLLLNIFNTNSNVHKQELWFCGLKDKKYTSHILWNSNNYSSHPRIKIDEEVDENNISRLPYLYYLRSDVHWVWTDKFKIFLKKILKNTTINKVGPILWYLPKNKMLFDTKSFNILLFDTNPYIKNMADYLTGEVMNYNIVDNMRSFINDIIKISETVQSSSNVKISIYLKRKKIFSAKNFPKNRNIEYVYFLDDLMKNKKELIYILEPETNIYSAICSSDLSITFPFSSPAYISSELKREAIFYDPTSKLKSIYEKNDYIKLISGKENLNRHISKLILTKKNNLN